MAGRLNKPGVDVWQILENRKPTAQRPVLVPVIVGAHKNIQYNLPLAFHYANNLQTVTIPTGETSVVQQKFSATSDISVFINSTRGLIKLTEGAAADYTISLDSNLGVDNDVTITASVQKSKVLADNSIAASISLKTIGSVNYIVIEDTSIDYSGVDVQPGDTVTIDLSTSVFNSAGSLADLFADTPALVVSSVEGPTTIRCTFADNNAKWVDETLVTYDISTPTLTGTGTENVLLAGAVTSITASWDSSAQAIKLEAPAATYTANDNWVGANLVVDAGSFSVGNDTYSNSDNMTVTAYASTSEIYARFDDIPYSSDFATDSVTVSSFKYTSYAGIAGQTYVTYDEGLVINDVNTIIEINGSTDILDNFGTIEPENPLGFHTLAGAVATDRAFYAVRVESDDTVGYEVALDSLKNNDDVYYVVPASQDDTVIALCKTHVDFMSDPYQKGERVTIVSKNIPAYDIVSDNNNTGEATGDSLQFYVSTTSSGSTTFKLLGSETADLTDTVPGHLFRVGSQVVQLADGTYIDDTKNRLVVLDYSAGGDLVKVSGQVNKLGGVTIVAGPSGTTVSGTITSVSYTGGDKARIIKEKAEAIDDKRVINIVPDTVEISVKRSSQSAPNYAVVESTSVENVSASVAAAALACDASSLAPTQPLTNMAVPGIYGAVGSNEELSSDNLDVIAGGGNWILLNTRGGGTVINRHQLTTAVSDVNTREFSVVRAIDYAAKIFREYLKSLVGKSVITDTFIKKVVRPSAGAAMYALVDGNILSEKSNIIAIYQNEDDPTRITIEVELVPLYPANYFTVKLYI
jgi:hypothetical protein